MKKNYKSLMKANNAVESAAPASRWGKGVPGKGGATTNHDATLKDREILRIIQGKEEHR